LVEFGPDAGGEGDAPEVISTFPEPSATAVALTIEISATFSTAMDPGTIDAMTFTLTQDGTPIPGAVTYDAMSHTATFTPDVELARDRLHTATITTGARDERGRALEADHAWSFTTANIEVEVSATTAESVPAPDYELSVAGIIVLTDAHNIVQSASGAVTLTAGTVTGQRYVVVEAAGLSTYAEMDGAYLAGADEAITAGIEAGRFALVGADLSIAQIRTLIIANISNGVRSYQSFEITFHPAG
jgi:hypothetical protein